MNLVQRQGIWRRIRRQMEREDGYVSTPILSIGALLLLLFILQLTLYYLSSNIAQGAAQAAYTTARSYEATAADGYAAAAQIIDNQSGFLTRPAVDVTHNGIEVTVTVSGAPVSLIPGLNLPDITERVTGPVERWVPAP